MTNRPTLTSGTPLSDGNGDGDALDPGLLERYWHCETSPEETTAVEAWFEVHPAQRAQYEQIRHGLGVRPRVEVSVADADRTINKVLVALAASGREAYTRDTERQVAHNQPFARRILGASSDASVQGRRNGLGQKHTLRRAVWYAVAGVALGSAALIMMWKAQRTHRGDGTSPSVSTYLTQNGQRANIVLTDGTTVALDVSSRLDVPADYPAGNHTLRLTGEAVFTVTHHDGTPFTVITGSTTARVLGTSFLVRHYKTDTTTTVAVRDGKVAVRADAEHAMNSIVLTAARQAEISLAGDVHLGNADLSQFSFERGVLTYRDGTLQDAIPVLDRWYNADIRLGDPKLATQRLTGEFAVGSVADLEDNLVVTFGVRVERVGRVLTLFPR